MFCLIIQSAGGVGAGWTVWTQFMFSRKLREVKRREVEKKRKEEEEKSEEEATPAKKLKKVGGVVSSPGIGFMRMDAEETNDEKKDDENEDENIKTVEIKPKK